MAFSSKKKVKEAKARECLAPKKGNHETNGTATRLCWTGVASVARKR